MLILSSIYSFEYILHKYSLDDFQCNAYPTLLDGPIAQLVEQLTFNQWVTGSNPVGLTKFPLEYNGKIM